MWKIRKYHPAIALLLMASCAVGPDYVKPSTVQPPVFKEAQQWKQATPKDTSIRSNWWEVFGDPELNKLETQVNISNQNIKASEAAFRQARALVAEARSAYFPTVGANGSATRSKSVGTSTNDFYDAGLTASWVPDLWGRVRRTVESNKANSQASAADLAGARLSAQSELAIDYLDLRLADEQQRLLDKTVEDYTRSFKITQNQYNAGIAAKSDVLQAQIQLESTQAQAIDVGVQRAEFEHAIAMLIGKAPADFSIAPVNAVPAVPAIPLDLPSALLERRPDIAGAERRVAAANAQIGIAEAAFFPDLTLSAAGGYESSSLSKWFSLPNRIWSIGPSVAETIFDAGLRSAQTEAAVAAYDQTVANYRQTVLSAFQEVEDNLASLRILEKESHVEQQAVVDADKSVQVFLNQYKAGTVSYLNVITAQATALSNKLTALTIEKERLTAAATLITDLGGGWDAKELDKPVVTTPKTTIFNIWPAVARSSITN